MLAGTAPKLGGWDGEVIIIIIKDEGSTKDLDDEVNAAGPGRGCSVCTAIGSPQHLDIHQ